MTCIVGIVDKKNKRVVMGADSQGTAGTNKSIRKDVKIFKNGEFLIGGTSSFRMIQLLRFSFKPPEIRSNDIYEYMCTDFITAIRDCFKQNGYIQKYTDGDEKGGTFLVAHKNRLFKVQNDFQVGETYNGLDACGCGQDFALGALLSIINDKNKTPEQKILKALKTTELLDSAVGKPFIILST